jgi:alkanesulfonate monooxygenase SsuD/methylene tetrahydromethanopterin reductase-like flavin-dependent oxidoreductase (luciferase family)
VLVGGRSRAALERTARFGDGWLGLWVSPQRFSAATDLIETTATEIGRTPTAWVHTLQLWAGFDATREAAIDRISRVMERSYGLPFERFERYTPCGRPEDIATALEPYLAAGCRRFNFVPEAPDLEHAVAAIAEVRRLLSDGRRQTLGLRPGG